MKWICTYMIAFFGLSFAMGQKVILIQKPVIRPDYDAKNHEEEIYFIRDSINARDNCPRIVVFLAEYSDSFYVINVKEDSVSIYSYDPMDLAIGNDKKHNNSTTPCFFFKHIQSIATDTIIISGMEFLAYHNKRMIKNIYSWKRPHDKAYRSKPIRSKSKPLIDTQPYPHLMVQGLDVGKEISLQRKAGNETAFFCSPVKGYSYHCEYETVSFTFVVDLAMKN